MTVLGLMPGYKECRAVDENMSSCLVFPLTAVELERKCEYACLAEEGIEDIFSSL
jgi:hypothetical protein